MDKIQVAEDVAEACADALLTACAAVLIQRVDVPPDYMKGRELAIRVIDIVIARSQREGAMPR